MITLPILVEERHVGDFYALLAEYHKDTEGTAKLIRTLRSGSQENVEKKQEESKKRSDKDNIGFVQKTTQETDSSRTGYKLDPKTNKTFHEFVVTECTCGTCFGRFARDQRTPWRGDGKGNFVNSEYGNIKLTGCPVTKFAGAGSIHRSVKSQERVARLQTIEDEIAQKRMNREATAHKLKTEAVATEARNAKLVLDIQARRKKEALEDQKRDEKNEAALQKATSELESIGSKHTDAYRQHLTDSEKQARRDSRWAPGEPNMFGEKQEYYSILKRIRASWVNPYDQARKEAQVKLRRAENIKASTKAIQQPTKSPEAVTNKTRAAVMK